jgi:hypothetical protein
MIDPETLLAEAWERVAYLYSEEERKGAFNILSYLYWRCGTIPPYRHSGSE